MSYVLGVDGGNTKTVALVASTEGTILGAGRGGCADIYNAASVEVALGAIEDAVRRALEQAGVQSSELVAGAFSVAGADWPEDYDLYRDAMVERGFGDTVTVVNDALGALRAGSPENFGVVVACGTGAATGARSRTGAQWHTSFWQEPQGGYQLGEKTLLAVQRAALGIDPPTSLTPRVLDYYGCDTVEELLHHVTKRGHERPRPDKLVRVLLDEAHEGDPTALRIVQDHGASLGDYVVAAARQVELESPFPLVLTGGVLRHSSDILADAIVERVRLVYPEVCPVVSRYEPVIGALFLALDSIGVRVDGALLQQVEDTHPPMSLFAT